MAGSSHYTSFLNKEEADELFNLTYCDCKWVPIPFRKGNVLHSIEFKADDLITVKLLSLVPNFNIVGSYAEYYQGGAYYTPEHHLKHTRIIVWLGSPRRIKIKDDPLINYVLNGDVLIVPGMTSLEVFPDTSSEPTMSITYFGDILVRKETKTAPLPPPLPPLPKEEEERKGE